jgi:hypothetical protein
MSHESVEPVVEDVELLFVGVPFNEPMVEVETKTRPMSSIEMGVISKNHGIVLISMNDKSVDRINEAMGHDILGMVHYDWYIDDYLVTAYKVVWYYDCSTAVTRKELRAIESRVHQILALQQSIFRIEADAKYNCRRRGW